jgi:hypothetical protein
MAKKKSLIEDPESLRNILMGIGAGLRSYDPNNPFAGAGAAMLATTQAAMSREEREEARRQRLEDLDIAERKQIAAEARAEERDIRGESRTEAAFGKRLEAGLKTKATERQQIRDEERAEREWQNDIAQGMGVYGLFGGYNPSNKSRVNPKFKLDFADEFGGVTSGAKPPASWSDNDLMDEAIRSIDEGIAARQTPTRKRRVRARDPLTGGMFFAIEDADQTTPLYGEKGRDYAD